MSELETTSYLKGLDFLFKKYNITEAYTFFKFDGKKSDSVVLHVNTTMENCNKISEYMDNYGDNDLGVPPELRSFCLPNDNDMFTECPGSKLVYANGKFYSTV